MDKETLGILTNKEVIAVNQDKLGKQGGRYMKVGEHEIWVKQLSNGEAAVCFFNRDEQPWNVETVLQKETSLCRCPLLGERIQSTRLMET